MLKSVMNNTTRTDALLINPERIVASRVLRGFTQNELARELNISQAHLSLMESGKRNVSPLLAYSIVAQTKLPITFFTRHERYLTLSNVTPVFAYEAEEFVHFCTTYSDFLPKSTPLISLKPAQHGTSRSAHISREDVIARAEWMFAHKFTLPTMTKWIEQAGIMIVPSATVHDFVYISSDAGCPALLGNPENFTPSLLCGLFDAFFPVIDPQRILSTRHEAKLRGELRSEFARYIIAQHMGEYVSRSQFYSRACKMHVSPRDAAHYMHTHKLLPTATYAKIMHDPQSALEQVGRPKGELLHQVCSDLLMSTKRLEIIEQSGVPPFFLDAWLHET